MGKPKSWLIPMLTGRGCFCISENKLGTSESVMCDVIKKGRMRGEVGKETPKKR